MPLTNFKIYLKLDQRLCNVTIADTTFKITNKQSYTCSFINCSIVTLSSKDNVKLVKLLEEGFKTPVYWNEHKTKMD